MLFKECANHGSDALVNLCETADSFYKRGYAFGSTGNISVRVGDRVWSTPTGKSLKGLNPRHLACVGLDGLSRPPASTSSSAARASGRSRPSRSKN
ncbi:MAG: class II aldolase/adducin family protein [Pyrinomonadaceae bacterium]